jgi:penicillin amidase
LDSSELEVLEILSAWNGDMNQNSSEPLIYVSWLNEFQRMIMKDDLGSLYKNITSIRPLFLERVLRDMNGASQWCDIVQTSLKETCNDMAKRALTFAIKKLKRTFGSDITTWRWGEAHIAVHKPQIVGSWPILSFFTNIVHEISGGNNTLMMSRTKNYQKNQFIANHGSILRAIYDFSDNEASLFVISTGQSGHFLSQHYADQSVLWQQEQYISLDYNKKFLSGTAPKIVFSPLTKLN